MDFGLSMYFINERKEHALDLLFSEIQAKVTLYEQHLATTVSLYNKEEMALLNENASTYAEAKKTAEAEYEKLYASMEGEEFAHDYASHHSGLDALLYNMQSQDEAIHERFTDLYRYHIKSSLAQAYAMLESELRMLCDLIQQHIKSRVSLDHLASRNYLSASITYLDVVADIKLASLEASLGKFRIIQILRNKIMHNGGEFYKGNVPEELTKILEVGKNLFRLETVGEREVLQVAIEMVQQFYYDIKYFFSEVFWIIDEKLNFQILSERLLYVLQPLAADLIISQPNVARIHKGRQVLFSVSSEKGNFIWECKITIEDTTRPGITILNQVGEHEMLERLRLHLSRDRSVLYLKLLKGFICNEERTKLAILIYPKE